MIILWGIWESLPVFAFYREGKVREGGLLKWARMGSKASMMVFLHISSWLPSAGPVGSLIPWLDAVCPATLLHQRPPEWDWTCSWAFVSSVHFTAWQGKAKVNLTERQVWRRPCSRFSHHCTDPVTWLQEEFRGFCHWLHPSDKDCLYKDYKD